MKTRPDISKQKEFLIKKLTSEELLDSAKSLTAPSSFILPYDPAQAKTAKEVVAALQAELPQHGVHPRVVNVYDTVLEILDEDDIFEELVELEPTVDRPLFLSEVKGAIDLEEELVPRVEEKAEGSQLLILTGIGESFPFVRAHRLLENIDVDMPVVTVFPGDYRTGSDGVTTLDILDIPQESGGGFYRARNIYDL
jgi:hypothetical protein